MKRWTDRDSYEGDDEPSAQEETQGVVELVLGRSRFVGSKNSAKRQQ